MSQHKKPSPSHIRAVMEIWSNSEEKTKFRAEGYCMFPLIKDGNTVHLVHGCKDIRVGDVVLCGEPDSYKLHRVVHLDKERNLSLLKGDNSYSIDPPVRLSEILAKVIAVEDENSVINYETWRWRLINAVIAYVSYLEVKIRARKSIFYRVMYLLCSGVGSRIGRLLRPNYFARGFITFRRLKVGRPTKT